MLYQSPLRPKIQETSGITNLYKVCKKLGSGYSATVYKAINKVTDNVVALKQLTKQMRGNIVREDYYEALLGDIMDMKHVNLCHLSAVYKTDSCYWQEIEYCGGKDMVDFTLSFPPGQMPMPVVKKVMCQILSAVKYMHDHHVVHRDLKLDNIMMSDEHVVKVIDFDMGYRLNGEPPLKDSGRSPVVGTREYMPPEGYAGTATPAFDIWSIGVILYIMLDGHFPFNFTSDKHRDCITTLRRGFFPSHNIRRRHPEGLELIKLMLNNKHDARPTASDLLRHPWFEAQKYIKLPGASSRVRSLRQPTALSIRKSELSNERQEQQEVSDFSGTMTPQTPLELPDVNPISTRMP